MKVGAVFPQTDIGADADAVRTYALRVEELGYDHLLAHDHVLGADPAVHLGWRGNYDIHSTFHEPLVLFGYLAAICSLELVTGIIILPQRQTALVAKQAAEVDILSRGRLRLGVGLGWNRVEYEALGAPFEGRGGRLAEQVEVLRKLWTQESVTHRSTHEVITGVGLAPLPLQRPIPIWFGAQAEPALFRAGRLADGWFPQVPPGPRLEEAMAQVAAGAQSVGRSSGAIGMEGGVSFGSKGPTAVAAEVAAWQEAGASHVYINTMGAGLRSIEAHLDALAASASALGLGRSADG